MHLQNGSGPRGEALTQRGAGGDCAPMRRLAPLFLALAACGAEASTPAPEPGAPGRPRERYEPVPTAAPLANADDPASPDAKGAPYPLVFLHGMGGFEQLRLGKVSLDYWEGLAVSLAKDGETEVFITQAPVYATSAARAKALKPQIDAVLTKTGRAKVNLVGHSQGGIDARYIASPAGLGYGDRVASVVTIATPHRGSRVADASLGLVSGLPQGVVDDVVNGFLGLLEKTAYDLKSDPDLRGQATELTEKFMTQTFNPTIVDDPRVYYASYAGRTNLRTGALACDKATYANEPGVVDAVNPLLRPTALFLEDGVKVVVNDGLVTVDSARWGEFLQCVPADHLKEIGMGDAPGGFEHRDFFRAIAKHLRSRGR